jgi:hypothetical protein
VQVEFAASDERLKEMLVDDVADSPRHSAEYAPIEPVQPAGKEADAATEIPVSACELPFWIEIAATAV